MSDDKKLSSYEELMKDPNRDPVELDAARREFVADQFKKSKAWGNAIFAIIIIVIVGSIVAWTTWREDQFSDNCRAGGGTPAEVGYSNDLMCLYFENGVLRSVG